MQSDPWPSEAAGAAALLADVPRTADRRHLRFYFEASSLRAAVGLAFALRRLMPDAVQVHPAPLRLLTRRRWAVVLTTAAAPVTPDVIHLWEGQMQEVAGPRPGSHLVRWKPALNLEDSRSDRR
jgi:hypothetical protein